MPKGGLYALLCIVMGSCSNSEASSSGSSWGLGRPATQAEIKAWDIDVSPGNVGLPSGKGSVKDGRAVYEDMCASCHGDQGEGGTAPRLRGGRGSLASAKPVMTIGSYWPYAETVFDYVRRAMPFNNPGILTASQVYAVTAYLLHLNEIVAEDAELDAASLSDIHMPNRNGFVPDPRSKDHL